MRASAMTNPSAKWSDLMSRHVFCFNEQDLFVRLLSRTGTDSDDFYDALIGFYSFKMMLIEHEHLLSTDRAGAEHLRQRFMETHRFESLREYLRGTRERSTRPGPVRKSVVLTYSKFSPKLENSRVLMVSDIQKQRSSFFKDSFEAFFAEPETNLVVHFDTASLKQDFESLMHETDALIREFSEELGERADKHIVFVCRKAREAGRQEVDYVESDWAFQVIESLSGSGYARNGGLLGESVDGILEAIGASSDRFICESIQMCLEKVSLKKHSNELVQKFLIPFVRTRDSERVLMKILFEIYRELMHNFSNELYADLKSEFINGKFLLIEQAIMHVVTEQLRTPFKHAILKMKGRHICVGLIMMNFMPDDMSSELQRVFDRGRALLFDNLK